MMKSTRKRILMSTILMFTVVFGGVVTVQAASSGVVLSPRFKLGEYSTGGIYELATEYAHAAPENTGVYFTRCGALESGYANVSDRDFPIYLTDDDGFFGDDDLKRYEGYFTGRKLDSVQYEELMDTSGNIDGTGDRIAELYLQGKLEELDGDSEIAGGTDMFYYEIIMN